MPKLDYRNKIVVLSIYPGHKAVHLSTDKRCRQLYISQSSIPSVNLNSFQGFPRYCRFRCYGIYKLCNFHNAQLHHKLQKLLAFFRRQLGIRRLLNYFKLSELSNSSILRVVHQLFALLTIACNTLIETSH